MLLLRRLFLAVRRAPAVLALACMALLSPGKTLAQDPDPTRDITLLLQRQAADWNRGDVAAFATGYKNSPDILFMGRTIEHGYAGMLEGYRKHYPTRASMGTLTFSQLTVQPLDARFATATGRFALQRTAAGGGQAGGYFLLVLENTNAGWRIIRDDTTSDPNPRP